MLVLGRVCRFFPGNIRDRDRHYANLGHLDPWQVLPNNHGRVIPTCYCFNSGGVLISVSYLFASISFAKHGLTLWISGLRFRCRLKTSLSILDLFMSLFTLYHGKASVFFALSELHFKHFSKFNVGVIGMIHLRLTLCICYECCQMMPCSRPF